MRLPQSVIVFCLVFAACSPDQGPAQTTDGEPTVAIDPQTGYPAPPQTSDLGYPEPGAGGGAVQGAPPPAPPAEAPPTAAGTASVSGVIYSRSTNTIIGGTQFYLIAASGDDGNQPPEILGPNEIPPGGIVGTTDPQGAFALAEIPPGRYFLFVWAPYDWRVAECGENDEGQRIIDLAADQRQPLGVVYAAWP